MAVRAGQGYNGWRPGDTRDLPRTGGPRPEDGMGEKIKPLCKWKQSQYIKQLEELKQIVADPKFVCRECGRAAGEKKWLCKPVRL